MQRIYPTCTYDTALPQEWVNLMIDAGFDPRGQVVWAYPTGVFGCPYPLSPVAAHKILSRTACPLSLLPVWKAAGLPTTTFDTEITSAAELHRKLGIQPLDKTNRIS